ncbi:arsenic efflux protein [bacterium]|nr:arsenic efflux protein [bacterium]
MHGLLNSIINSFKFLLEIPAHIIEPLPFLPDFAKDALIDSINLIPFLLIVFILIEVIEQYFAKKRHLLVFFCKKIGPLFGSLFASIPQCGFSVIASTLYTRRILTRGTVISVYLATSDEAIPILLTYPSKAYLILPVILIKVIVAVLVGYIVDLAVTYEAKEPIVEDHVHSEKGCCHHKLSDAVKSKDFWYHPLKHTLNIFLFILAVSLVLGFIISHAGTEENLAKYCLMNSPLQPLIAAIIGLIPNCAISVMFALLFVKNTISFGSLLAGLFTSGGLGILVLFKRNSDKKDTAIIISTLVIVATIIGLIFQYNLFNINNLFKIFGIQL